MFARDRLIEREEEQKHLAQATAWLLAQQAPHGLKQIEEAAQRFDLSPRDEEFLIRLFLSCGD